MKHLLIPTDFTIPSLNAVHAAIAKYGGTEPLKITLFHLVSQPNDISEMLFPNRMGKLQSMVPASFEEAYQVLQNRHSSRILSIHVKFGIGSTVAYLKNFLEGHQVNNIIFMQGYELQLPSSRSIAMLPLFRKTGIPLDIIAVKSKKEQDISAINMMSGNEIKISKEKNYAT